ncbi:hypothetical protein I4U23_007642 [Adineta vaga]|nr:hypothetical protein I4U23_007642 [Adineta vaga]
MDSSHKTRIDDFYTKLERIRLTAAASSTKQCSQRSATELLDESKGFFVKSQEVLHNRQSLLQNKTLNEQQPQPQQQQLTPSLRITKPRRSPYQDNQCEQDRFQTDSLTIPLRSSTPPISAPNSTTHFSDCGAFESVSLLSLSDQTTLDSANSPSNTRRTVVPSTSLSVIERNARIIKWLFQLNKANASPSFQEVQ